jgi:hypothetical protein
MAFFDAAESDDSSAEGLVELAIRRSEQGHPLGERHLRCVGNSQHAVQRPLAALNTAFADGVLIHVTADDKPVN